MSLILYLSHGLSKQQYTESDAQPLSSCSVNVNN
uniref:Uncharacterized protein n=1 Tax=Anguilla anguilla TaxID=7936 RepID=A0A0E9Q426_ANGAN